MAFVIFETYTERTVQLSQLKVMHRFFHPTHDISLSQLIFRLPPSILQKYLRNYVVATSVFSEIR